MINRICISINNRCNLACRYCHFREKGLLQSASMDIFEILDNVKRYATAPLKIGFVGNGEPFLDWPALKSYILHLSDSPFISTYTITNGTILLSEGDWDFLECQHVNVGFSIDGYRELHNLNRCGSFDKAMKTVERYQSVTGHYPTFNATVGRESLLNADKVIDFFERFGTRITFSRMIGKYGIPLDAYRNFLDYAEARIPIRRGEKDCTMYGGQCGAGTNNYFFANGFVYYCGNCVDLPPLGPSGIPLSELQRIHLEFDRSHCYKESL